MADHSHKWHNEENDKNSTPLKMIAEKLNSLNHDMGSLRKDFSLRETFECYLLESYKRQEGLDEWIKRFIQKIDQDLIRHNAAIKSLGERVTRLANTISTNQSNQTPITHPASDNANSVKQECAMKLEPSHEYLSRRWRRSLRRLRASSSVMPFSMFKRLGLGNPKPINIMIEMADRSMQSPKGIVENVLVKNHNFIFPVDFVIIDIIEDDKVPLILGRPMLATAHAKIDVFGKKISLEVGTEQIVFNANEGTRSLTVLPVCIINDYQVIDDLGDLEGLEEAIMNEDINGDIGNFLEENGLLSNFDGQEGISFSPSCSSKINKDSYGTFQDPNNMSSRIDNFEIDDLWDDLDLGVLTSDNDWSKPEFFSTRNKVHQHNPYNLQVTFKRGFVNFNPYIDPHFPFNIISRAAYNTIMSSELIYIGNNIVGLAWNLSVFIGYHTFLTDFIVVENIHEFIEKGLTEVLFGKPFEDQTGLEEDLKRGVIWFKVRNDKTIFNMPHAERRFSPYSKEVEFEVISTHNHVVKILLQLVIDPCVLAILKGNFDSVSPFIKQTAKLRITKELFQRGKVEAYASDVSAATRAIKEPRVVVQIASEVDILDDVYRWPIYGQEEFVQKSCDMRDNLAGRVIIVDFSPMTDFQEATCR
ncbi:homeodomain-like protein [Tanacetum coccineum]|uniref:Homeodomain-like protein n=1 Tax=Tanacetum coccineum TaxID=301880 RepID=A0ABQ4XH48_9ASTR